MNTDIEKQETAEDGKLIRISKEADEALSSLLQRANTNEGTTKVTKWSLASFILEKFCPDFSDSDLKEVYMRTVNEIDLFRHAYKRAMETGIVPDNIREILFANAGLTPGPRKAKKTRQRNGSNATHIDTEQA